MDLCILDQAGETRLPRPMPATPEARLTASTPSREQIVLAAAGLCPWDWRADLCADPGSPCGRGHALSMQALHGGKATHDPSDAHPIAGLWRGGRLPHASVSPAARRATRDLLRRRRPLARPRGARLAPVHPPNSPSTLPAMGPKIADKAHRDGVAERCAAPAGQKSLAVARALITSDAALRRAGARALVTTATPHDAQTLSRLPTVPGLGTSLRLGLLDDRHASARVPRGQAVASSGRLVTGATASAGPRSGTSGSPIGQAHRTWALA